MKFTAFGKENAPVVLLFSDSAAAVRPLFALAEDYRTVLIEIEPGDTADEAEAYLRREFYGRVRGACAVGAGASLLTELLSRGQVQIEKCVFEGGFALSEGERIPGEVHFWLRKGDRAAGKTRRRLRGRADVRTLTVKGLDEGAHLADVRPDLAIDRLEKIFGGGAVVTSSRILPVGAEELWKTVRLYDGLDAPLVEHLRTAMLDEEARVFVTEGEGGAFARWCHRTELRPLGSAYTECVERVEFDAGKRTKSAVKRVQRHLNAIQNKREKLLKRANNAL